MSGGSSRRYPPELRERSQAGLKQASAWVTPPPRKNHRRPCGRRRTHRARPRQASSRPRLGLHHRQEKITDGRAGVVERIGRGVGGATGLDRQRGLAAVAGGAAAGWAPPGGAGRVSVGRRGWIGSGGLRRWLAGPRRGGHHPAALGGANHQHPSTDHLDCHPKDHARNLHSYTTSLALARCQAQLEPTALSVCAMLLPAACTFCPWALACS